MLGTIGIYTSLKLGVIVHDQYFSEIIRDKTSPIVLFSQIQWFYKNWNSAIKKGFSRTMHNIWTHVFDDNDNQLGNYDVKGKCKVKSCILFFRIQDLMRPLIRRQDTRHIVLFVYL